MAKKMHDTPMLDQLESGPWPSFVTGLKRLANDNDMMPVAIVDGRRSTYEGSTARGVNELPTGNTTSRGLAAGPNMQSG